MNRPLSRPRPLPSRLLTLLRVGMLVGWMGVIFMFSADADSGATSGGLVDALVGFLTGLSGPISPEIHAGLHMLLRKTAHFSEYAILALLWVGVLPKRPRRLWLAFGLTAGYAVSDEIHQAFVPSRGPSPLDVLIDAGGAATALSLLWLLKERHLDSVTKIH